MGSQVPAQVVENRLLLLTSIVVDIADLLRDRLVPRDRADTFELQIVKKRQRRLSGVDQIVLLLYAKGLTTEEISSHVADIYGASVSKETISRTTDQVIAEMQEWQTRPPGRDTRGEFDPRDARADESVNNAWFRLSISMDVPTYMAGSPASSTARSRVARSTTSA